MQEIQTVTVSKETVLAMYEKMVKTRFFDDKIKSLIDEGYRINEHSTRGQEAGPVGACAALNDDDYIMPYHRGWAWGIGKGLEPKYMLAELMGKSTGYMHGKGGAHFGFLEKCVLGKSGVIGANIPIAAGVGLAMRQQNSKKVCISFLGSGACNTGYFHEGMNLAALWKVPIIYFCEDNKYQMSDRSENVASYQSITNLATAYNIEHYTVDGNDALECYSATSKCVKKARDGKGPFIIEVKTYRMEGHSFKDSFEYKSQVENNAWKEKDPILRLERELVEIYKVDEADLLYLQKEIFEEIEQAADFAIQSPYPDKEEILSGVYCDGI